MIISLCMAYTPKMKPVEDIINAMILKIDENSTEESITFITMSNEIRNPTVSNTDAITSCIVSSFFIQITPYIMSFSDFN